MKPCSLPYTGTLVEVHYQPSSVIDDACYHPLLDDVDTEALTADLDEDLLSAESQLELVDVVGPPTSKPLGGDTGSRHGGEQRGKAPR